MPEFSYEPRTLNDKSSLTDGRHPAFLVEITEEPIPPTWKSYKKELSAEQNMQYRWHFVVYESPGAIDANRAPERQTAVSSKAFSPKGKLRDGTSRPASKAFSWTCELLNRQIQPGERVNLDPILPIPCSVKVERNGEYANILDLERWPDGARYVTPEVMATLRDIKNASPGSSSAPAPSQQLPPPEVNVMPAPASPALASWGSSSLDARVPQKTGWGS